MPAPKPMRLDPLRPDVGDVACDDLKRLFRAVCDELALRRPVGALHTALRQVDPRTRDALALESREAAR